MVRRTTTQVDEFTAAFFDSLKARYGEAFARVVQAGHDLTELGDPDELAERVVASTPLAVSPLEQLTGPFYDTSGLAAWLGISRQALDSRAKNRTLLALRTGNGQRIYPAWQFTSAKATLPHLSEVLQALASGTDDPWTWALWLTSPGSRQFLSIPAWRWLAEGRDPQPLLAEAHAEAARWAA